MQEIESMNTNKCALTYKPACQTYDVRCLTLPEKGCNK